MAEKTLIEKLVAVAQAVRYIEKGGSNSAQGYKFVGEAQVVEAVGPKLLEQGVLAYPRHRVTDIRSFDRQKEGKPAPPMILTTIETTWVFTDGTDDIRVVTVGQGSDTGGDKGIYKAMTGSKKYGLLQALMIATGDDPEETRADEREERAAPASAPVRTNGAAEQRDDSEDATEGQLGKMFGDAKRAGIDKDALKDLVKNVAGRYSSKQLKKGDMDAVFQAIAMVAASKGEVESSLEEEAALAF